MPWSAPAADHRQRGVSQQECGDDASGGRATTPRGRPFIYLVMQQHELHTTA